MLTITSHVLTPGIVGLLQIKYGSAIQLGLLRLLNEEATQRFTFYCSGAVAWFDQSTGDHSSALLLKGDNDYDFDTQTFSLDQVIEDSCRVGGVVIRGWGMSFLLFVLPFSLCVRCFLGGHVVCPYRKVKNCNHLSQTNLLFIFTVFCFKFTKIYT